MINHDPLQFVSSLGAKLATRSRHVCALFGAGVGRSCGLPDVEGLRDQVLDGLDPEKRAALERQLVNHDLEGSLSRVRRISALISGNDTVDGLTSSQAEALDKAVCQLIVESLCAPAEDMDAMICLAAWAARANYNLPLELFTLNYDLLLERAFEEMRVPYFDGFIGSLRARFHTELVEASPGTDIEMVPPFFVRLWKLHGSVNWVWNKNGEIVRLGDAVPKGLAAAIYPADTKYEESRRVPFVVLQDRFKRALHQPETLMIIAGYSFSDDHINEQIFDAATRRQRSEFIVFSYSDIPKTLAQRAEMTPNIQVVAAHEAIIGGVRGNWKESDDAPSNIWRDDSFALPDFKYLARHLALSTSYEFLGDKHIRDLLAKAILGGSNELVEDTHD